MTTGTAPAGAITEAELAAAFTEAHPLNSAANPAAAAASVFAYVKAHREPEYEPGTLVIDEVGDVYRRCNEMAGDAPWLGWGGHLHPESAPVRPLRKLVPGHAHPGWHAVLREIVRWLQAASQPRVLADRICELMGAGDE